MNIVQTYGKEIVSLLVPFIAWGLSAFFKNKPRLRIAQPHTFTFVAPPILDNNGVETSAGLTVHTRSFLIYNDGREAATKLELVFNWKPLCLNIWPPRRYTEQVEPDKRYILIFESLSPDEALGCEVLSVKEELPNLLTVRSDQSEAKFINYVSTASR